MATEFTYTLSIAVLTYKQERTIKQTLEGIALQKINCDYEIVISDDCSPDNTREVIRQFALDNPQLNIRTLFQEANLGMWQNFKQLLNALKGKYVAFVEGDDYWTDPLKIQQQLDFLEKQPGFVCCFHAATVVREQDSNNKLTFNRYPDWDVPAVTSLTDFLEHGNFVPSASMMLRNVFIGNYPEYIFDRRSLPDTMLHMLQASKGQYYFINKEMSVYRLNAGGVTETRSHKAEFVSKLQMIKWSNAFSDKKYKAEHFAALRKYHYYLLDGARNEGNKREILKYLFQLVKYRKYDKGFHANFIVKTFIAEILPGGKQLLHLLGK